jgi:hypothetical protein
MRYKPIHKPIPLRYKPIAQQKKTWESGKVNGPTPREDEFWGD